MLRNLLFVLLSCLFFSTTNAQTPELINYQTVVRDVSGNIIQNQNISLRFSVLEGSIGGTTVYQEIHLVTTNNLGLVNTVLGGGLSTVGVFGDIEWSDNSYFLQTELDLSSGNNFSIMGTQQLISVPYALHAKTVDDIGLSASSIGCGDTLWTGGGNFVIIPGITQANGIIGCAPDISGLYNGVDNCTSGSDNYLVSVENSVQCSNCYSISNLYSSGIVVAAQVDQTENITIPLQNFSNGTIVGTGTVSGNTITITYTISVGGQSDSCTLVATIP